MIFPFLFAVEELYGTRYQSDSFSLINVGSSSHCLRCIFSFSCSKPDKPEEAYCRLLGLIAAYWPGLLWLTGLAYCGLLVGLIGLAYYGLFAWYFVAS